MVDGLEERGLCSQAFIKREIQLVAHSLPLEFQLDYVAMRTDMLKRVRLLLEEHCQHFQSMAFDEEISCSSTSIDSRFPASTGCEWIMSNWKR